MIKMGLVCGALLMGCGGDDGDAGTCEDDGGAACFEVPTAALVSYDENDNGAPANYACAPAAIVDTTALTTFSGTVKNYISAAPLAGVTIEAHADLAFSSSIASTTTASDGSFSVEFPVGTPNVFHVKATGSAILPGFAAYQTFDITDTTIDMIDFRGPTVDLVDTVSGIVRVEARAGTAIVGAVVQDCDKRPVENAVVTISTAQGAPTHAAGFNVFYGAPGPLPLPVIRSEATATSNNGAAVIMNVAPSSGTLFAQAWGFVNEADVAEGRAGLTLLASWEVPVEADAVTAAFLRASEGP
jgi:hypothetical protein